MAEPGEAPGVSDVVRRWAERLAATEGITLSPERLEESLSGLARDVVAETEPNREAAVRRFTSLYSASPVGIALADPTSRIVEVNSALTGFLGRRADELRGQMLADLGFGERDAETILAALEELAETNSEHVRRRIELAHADDGSVWAEVTLTYLPGDKPGAAFPALMAVDVNDLHELQEALRRQSVHDALTGLANTSQFTAKLEAALTPSASDQVALIYLDLDGFRVINDGIGPSAGDKLLRAIAHKLKEAFTSHEALVARLAGDGFAVLLRGKLSSGEVIMLVEQALEDIAEPIYLGDKGIGLSASAGIVVANVTEANAEELQRGAELALHRAKEAGRAQWMLFDPDLDAHDRSRYRLAAEIAGGLENGEFTVVYYPMVSLADPSEIVTVNAGLRWDHPERGVLEAAEFYPLAETTGMTAALGRWVISESLATIARLREQYGDNTPEMSIKLATRLARDPDLVKLIREQLDRHKLPASVVRLCLMDRAVLDEQGEVLDSLVVLTDLGAKLVVIIHGSDDLELIPRHNLAVRHVILTGAVIDEFADGEPGEAAVRHLTYLVTRAAELGLRISAEGVRSAEHAERLHRHGVATGIGPFACAVTSDGLESLLDGQTG